MHLLIFLWTCFSYRLALNVAKLTVHPSNQEAKIYLRNEINRFLVVLFSISNKNQTRLLYILCINGDGLFIVFSFIELVGMLKQRALKSRDPVHQIQRNRYRSYCYNKLWFLCSSGYIACGAARYLW